MELKLSTSAEYVEILYVMIVLQFQSVNYVYILSASSVLKLIPVQFVMLPYAMYVRSFVNKRSVRWACVSFAQAKWPVNYVRPLSAGIA